MADRPRRRRLLVLGIIVAVAVMVGVPALLASGWTLEGTVEDPNEEVAGPLRAPCQALAGDAGLAGMTSEPSVTPGIATCDYTGDGRTAQLLLFDERADVARLLERGDCRPIALAVGGASACAFDHPLGTGGTGAGLVVRGQEGAATLSIEGEPPTVDQLDAAAARLARLLA